MAVSLHTDGQSIAKALWPGVYQIIEQQMECYVDEALKEIRKKIDAELATAIKMFVEPALGSNEVNLILDARFGKEFDK